MKSTKTKRSDQRETVQRIVKSQRSIKTLTLLLELERAAERKKEDRRKRLV